MELAEFLSRLEGVKKRGRFYTARCPGREDKNPSLSVWEEGGWIKLKDWGGKMDDQDIVRALGLENRDLRIESAPEHQAYTYKGRDGKPVFQKVRSVGENGKKTFKQQGMSGEFNLAHLNGQAKNLYCLPEVLRAVAEGRTVYINEGEKACDALRAEKVIATCQPGGADVSASKWLDCHTETLKGANVVIVSDRDEVGESYAKSVYLKLKGVASSVRVVRPKVEEDKADAFDHLCAGYNVDEFVLASDLMPSLAAKVNTFAEDDFESVEIEYLVDPYLPKGKAVLLDADGGTGKSSLALALAAMLSNGKCLFGEKPDNTACRTLYVGVGEDSDQELETIYRANGGRPGMIHYLNEPGFVLDSEGLAILEDTITDCGASLVVIDALLYFMPLRNANEAFEVMQVMRPLMAVYRNTGATGLHIRHTGKQSKDSPRAASDIGFGSVQFRNSHRGQMVMRFHPEDKGLVIVTDEKGSILVPRGEPFAFRRRGQEVQFVSDFENPFDRQTGGRMTAQAEIEEFLLRNVPADSFIKVRDLDNLAENAGLNIHTGTWKRAKAKLCLVTKLSDGWNVTLKAGDSDDPFA